MKKLYSFLLLILVLGTAAVNAQESDQKALDLLGKVAKKTQGLPGFYVEYQFDVIDIAEPENNQTLHGKMWYRDGKYKMEMLGQVVYSDGTTNWVYQEEIEEVTITTYSEEETSSLIDPNYLLENYATDYVCRFVTDKFENNRPLVEIHLFPIDIENSSYSRIKLKLDKVKMELFEFTFVANEGINYKITLNQFKGDSPVTDEMVSFNEDLYPDAEIIDMRD